jgi:glycosyltransferase involved in cell wall biosynthesis
VRLICSRLNPEFYDITLVTGLTKHPSKKTKEFLGSNLRKVVFIPELKRNINPISDLAAFIRLYFLFLREKFDIVHTHTAKAGALARIAAFLSVKSIIVYTPHGLTCYGYFGPLGSKLVLILEKLLARITDRIAVLSKGEKEDFEKFKISSAVKISVITSGIDLDEYNIDTDAEGKKRGFGIKEGEFTVGMIARLETVKGPSYFIEAAPFILSTIKNVKFLVIGDGELRDKLKILCEELGVADKFIFTGWREDIREILRILDVVVLVSLNEAIGRIILEAGSCAKPVVATAVGGIPSVIEDRKTGILVPPKSPQKIAQAVIELLADANKRQEMGRCAKEQVRANFGIEKMMRDFDDLYKGLLIP